MEGDTVFVLANECIRKEVSATVRSAEREGLSMRLSGPSVIDPMTSASNVDSRRQCKGGLTRMSNQGLDVQ